MKQKLFIFVFLILLVGLLAALNAASYVQKEKTPDSEFSPNRSTYNSGVTGTQALYTLLFETGRKVTRWQEPPAALLTAKTNKPAVFVVIGSLRRDFTPPDAEALLQWVSAGGRLIVIDRDSPEELLKTTANWKLVMSASPKLAEIFGADPSDQQQMTHDIVAVKPVQPTLFTQRVNAVQPSKFAASLGFERTTDGPNGDHPPPPRPRNSKALTVEAPSDKAPIVHFASGDRNLLVEAPYGGGKIVFLTDPYMISNGGINLVDNAQMAINMVAAGDGMVAFDEYHQGYGTDSNRFLQFFAGTPIVAIFAQALILVGFVFYSQSRRFARAVPEPEPDRLSKLEYVAAMAELQQRTRAYDLAIENIYSDFRRRTARLLGLDGMTATSRELAVAIAERTGLDRAKTEETLFKCEDIIRGEPTNKREVVALTGALRDLEATLGIKRAVAKKI